MTEVARAFRVFSRKN